MQTTSLSPSLSSFLTLKADAKPSNAPAEGDRPAESEAFGKDTLTRFRAEAPRIAVQSVPYLHGATVGHEGLHVTEEARIVAGGHRKASALECGPSIAAEATEVGGAVGVAVHGIAASARSSALLGGALSVALHAYRVARGREDVAGAGALVAGDVVLAGIGGAAGAATSTLAAAVLGISCGPFAIVGMGFGIAGYMAAEWLLRETPAYRRLVDGLYHVLGGKGEAPRE